MNYILNTNSLSNFFSIPNSIIDHYVNEVEFNYIKVILFIYRNKNQNLTLDTLSKALSIPKEDVDKSIKFWISNEVLPNNVKSRTQTTDDVQISQTIPKIYLDKLEEMIEKALKPQQELKKSIQLENSYHKIIKSSFADITKEDDHLQISDVKDVVIDDTELYNFMEHVQYILSRPITYAEKTIFCDIIDLTKLPIEVILMAVEHCVKINKTNIKYIKKICEDWEEKNINTYEIAENYLMELKKLFSIESKIKNYFGINKRNLSSKEKQLLNKWVNILNFDLDMITLAYDKTVDTIGEMSFPYINSILESWNKNNITSIDQANNFTNKSTKKNFNKNLIKVNSTPKDTSYELDTFDLLFDNVPEF